MGFNIVEHESHALFKFDLYAKRRSKLTSINSAPQITTSEQNRIQKNSNIDNVTASNLESYLKAILSPNITQSDGKIKAIAEKIHDETFNFYSTIKILSHSSNLGSPTLQTAYTRLLFGKRKRERT